MNPHDGPSHKYDMKGHICFALAEKNSQIAKNPIRDTEKIFIP